MKKCLFVEFVDLLKFVEKSTSDFENGSTKIKINKSFSSVFGALGPCGFYKGQSLEVK